MTDPAPLLEIDRLAVEFSTRGGVVRAVDGVSFSIFPGETLALVGESGCGKSVTAMSVLRLIPTPPSRVVGGDIRFAGDSLLTRTEREMQAIRGERIAMIFQEPMTSLNPALTIGRQIKEPLRLHRGFDDAKATTRAAVLLERVGLPAARRRLLDYPHQLSGGMRQRVMIAMALACEPALLLADEPTTALDVTVQAQILDLMRSLKQDSGAAILLITHDLGVVAEMARRVIVMYAGRKVEEAKVEEIFARPLHPYTQALLASVPRLGSSLGGDGRKRLSEIEGAVPTLAGAVEGCAFAPRCRHASEICRRETPAERDFGEGRLAACHHA